jgi:hypothetical protein
VAGKRRRRVIVRLRAEAGPDEQGRCRWLARWTKDGKRDSATLGWLTEEQAELERERTEDRLRLGMTPSADASSSSTVREIAKFYLRDLVDQGSSIAHVANETDRLEQVLRILGHVEAGALSQSDLEQYVGRRRRDTGRVLKGRNVGGGKRGETPARSTVLAELRVLIRVFRVARKRGKITCDPPPWPVMKSWPEDGRPARRLLEDEVAALARHAERPELARLILFLAWCPRRPVAVAGIRRRDCERVLDASLPRAQRQVFIRRDKGGHSTGWCPLTEPALTALVEQLEATEGDPDALVWTSETGRELTPALLWWPFQRAARAAGLRDVQVYDLRRFGAVHIQNRTNDLEETCEFTGHKDVRTLLRYLSARRGAAEARAGTITWSKPQLELVEGDEGAG